MRPSRPEPASSSSSLSSICSAFCKGRKDSEMGVSGMKRDCSSSEYPGGCVLSKMFRLGSSRLVVQPSASRFVALGEA